MELEDPWCSYACLSLWAWSGRNGLGYHLQHLEKHARLKNTYSRSINCLKQLKIVFDCSKYQISKIFYNPKLRWHLRVKCICQLTFIFFFLKTSRNTLDLKLNVKGILSNIHTASDLSFTHQPRKDAIPRRRRRWFPKPRCWAWEETNFILRITCNISWNLDPSYSYYYSNIRVDLYGSPSSHVPVSPCSFDSRGLVEQV